MNFRHVRHTLLCTGMALVVAACGDAPLDPAVTGLVNAVVHDTPAVTAAFAGTAAGNMHVSIRPTGGTWVDVGTPNGITVALQSTTPTSVHGSTSVPAGTYDQVRLTLSGITFTVTTGGGGLNTGSAEAAGSADLEMEVSVPDFTVSTSAGTASVSFDLHVEDWLTDQMLSDGVIADGDLTGQLTATVTSG